MKKRQKFIELKEKTNTKKKLRTTEEIMKVFFSVKLRLKIQCATEEIPARIFY